MTGNFTGTTDELVQWAAHKWALYEGQAWGKSGQLDYIAKVENHLAQRVCEGRF